LPIEDKIVQILDFVELKDSYAVYLEKIKSFSQLFPILKEEDKGKLQSELIRLKNMKIEFYRNSSQNLFHMWDLIEKQEKFEILPKLVRFAETLPTSSATIEQSFSNVKLLKTQLRNRLSEKSLKGLILVGQEFREKQDIEIGNEVITLYKKVRQEFISGKENVLKIESLAPEPPLEKVPESDLIKKFKHSLNSY